MSFSKNFIIDRKRNFRIFSFSVIVILLVFSGIISFKTLNQTAYANGWDGYYYLIQVKSWFLEGRMHSPDISPVYWIMFLLRFFTSDYILIYKLSAVLIKSFFILNSFYLAFTIFELYQYPREFVSDDPDPNTGESNGKIGYLHLLSGVSVSSFMVMSPSLHYFTSQFPKNLLGFSFLILFINLIFKIYIKIDPLLYNNSSSSLTVNPLFGKLRAGDKKALKNIILDSALCLIIFFLVFITHRFSGGLAVIFTFSAGVSLIIRKYNAIKKSKKNGHLPVWLISGIIFFVFLCFTLIIILSEKFPGILNFTDIKRFYGMFSKKPVFAVTEFMKLLGPSKFSFLWKLELFFLFLLTVFSIIFMAIVKLYNKKFNCFFFIPFIIISCAGLFPFSYFDLSGMAYRFFLGYLVFSPFFLLIPLLGFYPIRYFMKKNTFYQNDKKNFIPVLSSFFTFLFLILSFFSWKSYNPKLFDPPYSFYEKLGIEAISEIHDRNYQLIIAHKALAEIITFKTGKDCLPWKNDSRYPSDKVWRLAAGISLKDLIKYFEPNELENKIFRLKSDYILIREDMWELFVKRCDPARYGPIIFSWRNPMEIRPDFITKNRNYK